MKELLKGTEEEIKGYLIIGVGLGRLKGFKVVSLKKGKTKDNYEMVIEAKGQRLSRDNY